MNTPDWEVPVLGGSAAVEPLPPPGAGAGAGSCGTPQMTCSTARSLVLGFIAFMVGCRVTCLVLSKSWELTFRQVMVTCKQGAA